MQITSGRSSITPPRCICWRIYSEIQILFSGLHSRKIDTSVSAQFPSFLIHIFVVFWLWAKVSNNPGEISDKSSRLIENSGDCFTIFTIAFYFLSGMYPRKQEIRTYLQQRQGSDLCCLVRATGLEPARETHQNLNLARLPIPPYPQKSIFIIRHSRGNCKGGTRKFCLLFTVKECILSYAGVPCGQSRHPDLKKY